VFGIAFDAFEGFDAGVEGAGFALELPLDVGDFFAEVDHAGDVVGGDCGGECGFD